MDVIAWRDPLAMLRGVIAAGYHDVALLYSGLKTGYSGRYSYLAYDVQELVEVDSFDVLSGCVSDSELPHHYGFIHYEMLHDATSHVPTTEPASIASPLIRFVEFATVLCFDHEQQVINIEGAGTLPEPLSNDFVQPKPAVTITSPMSKDEYIDSVQDALEQIHAGNFYQANLTRKYCGTFDEALTPQSACNLFTKLCDISPAPYSAFLAHEGHYTISSSPELFIAADADGTMTTRPIKGTASRKHTAQALRDSPKDRAENLMIVDLMRNDVSRCAKAGSVQVPELFEVDSFATLHHLSSTITAIRQEACSCADMLRATFPPGSMTGAPKLAAMQWIASQEKLDRGIYSGAIGWIDGDMCELSVVIRTLVAEGSRCEFQVGGGIVADSDPENEYEEILTKSRAIATLLGVELA